MVAGVDTICEECEGKRFEASVLDHHLGGRDISEVLAMSVTEARLTGGGRLRTIGAVSMDIRDLIRLRKAKDRMDREFDRPLDVPALARSAAMSTGHFSRSFKAAFGESPYSYLMTRRIERAKALLRRGDMSVTDACMAVGCTSLGSFSSRFTELVGESPSAYRARSHSAAAVIPDHVIKVMTKPIRNEEAPAPNHS
jgi:transcriptional regulator GlxA family with amidase domain